MKKFYKNRHFWLGFIACAVIIIMFSLVSEGSLAASGGGKKLYQYPHDPNAADQTPPSLAISAPLNGYVVDNSVSRSLGGKYGNFFLVPLRGFASDNVNLQNIVSFVDGNPDASVLDFGLGFNNYNIDWTARVPVHAGTHVITVRAWDYNGNMTEESVNVVVPKGLK